MVSPKPWVKNLLTFSHFFSLLHQFTDSEKKTRWQLIQSTNLKCKLSKSQKNVYGHYHQWVGWFSKSWTTNVTDKHFEKTLGNLLIRAGCFRPRLSPDAQHTAFAKNRSCIQILDTTLTRKIKFLKLKERPRDIILHISTINDNHVIYGSWDMEHDRQNLLSFWTIFCIFTPLKTQKIKILKNRKKSLGDGELQVRTKV